MLITTLDQDLMQWLLRLPCLRLDDLVPLLAAHASRTTIARHVRSLEMAGLVASVEVGAAMPYSHAGQCLAYYLTNNGIVYLATRNRVDPFDLARAWGSDETSLLRLLARMPEVLRVQRFVTSLMSGAPAAYGGDVGGHWRWVRGYRHPFRDLRQHLRLTKVDAAITVQMSRHLTSGYASAVFVLADQAVIDWGQVRHTFATLLAWRESAERWPVYQHFPVVLALVLDERHREHFEQCNIDAARSQGTAPLCLASAVLHKEDFDGPNTIWSVSWRDAVSQTAIGLRQIMSEMPEAALPPEMQGRSLPASGADAPVERTRPIVVGRYAERTHAAMPHTRRSAALVAFHVPQAVQTVLSQIVLMPDVPVADLALMLGYASSSLERVVRQLVADQLVTITRDKEQGSRVRLSAWGQQVVAMRYALSRTGSVLRRAVSPPQAGEAHETGVYHFCACLIAAARTQPGHAVLWWETATRGGVRYQLFDRWYNLRPDAVGVYQMGYRSVRWWLEWDTGTMNSDDLDVKFRSYARYVASRQWHVEGITSVPLLLFVAPHYQQGERIRRVAAAVLPRDAAVAAYLTLADRLEADGPLAAIWSALGAEAPSGFHAVFGPSSARSPPGPSPRRA